MNSKVASSPREIVRLLPKNIISVTVFKWTLPLSIFLAVVTTPKSIPTYADFFTWVFIGVAAHIAMFPFVYYGRDKRFAEQLLLVLLMGFVRGALVSVLAPLFGLQDSLPPIERISNSMIAVFYWSQAGSIIVEYGIDFRRRLRELLNEVLEKNIGGLPEAAKKSTHAIIENIGHLQERIMATVGNSPTKESLTRATREIDALITEYIKPLSQSRWRDGELVWLHAGFGRVLKRTLSLNPIPVISVIVLTAPFTLVVQITSIGLMDTLIVQLFWISTVVLLVNVIYQTPSATNNYLTRNILFLFVLPIAYVAALIAQVNSPFSLPETLASYALGYGMSYITQIAAYLIGTLLLALRSDQDFVFEFISDVIKAGELEKLLTKTKSGNLDVNYAQYLHAEVQSQLLACKLLLLKASETDFELFPPEVTKQIVDRMEKIKQPYQKPSARIPARRLAELQASWSGLAEISFNLEPELSELEAQSDVISQLIEESVVNSIRHGKATSIHVSSCGQVGEVEITVTDNGNIPSYQSGSGLGTILFNTFAKNWQLNRVGTYTVLTFTVERSGR